VAALTAACEVCGQPVPAGAVMCPRCGAPFTASPFAQTADADRAPSGSASASALSQARPAAGAGQANPGTGRNPPADADWPPPGQRPDLQIRAAAVRAEGRDGPPAGATCPQCGLGDLPAETLDCPSCGFALGGAGWAADARTAAGSVEAAQLLVAGQVIDIPAGEAVVLGRDPGASALAGALSGLYGVSRRHASVTVRGRTVTIQDFDSTNGTWVDGERLGAGAAVRDLPARFRLGQSVEVEVRAGGQADPPTIGPAS
jgi:hypothetical protein